MKAKYQNRVLVAAMALGTILLLLGFWVVLAQGGTVKEDVVDPSFEVRVSADRICGSGTLIKVGDEELVLTAYHVVADAFQLQSGQRSIGPTPITVPLTRSWAPLYLYQQSGSEKKTVRGSFVWGSVPSDEGGWDLALVRPDKPLGLKPSPTAFDTPLEIGEDVWYCGTPAGLHRSLEKSIINQVGCEKYGGRFTVVNGNGWYGNSGGGLFVKRGDQHVLVGVVVVGITAPEGNPKTPLGAVEGADILKFLGEYAASKKPPLKPAVDPLPLPSPRPAERTPIPMPRALE